MTPIGKGTPMFSRKLQAAVLTIAGLGVFAGSAHAAVIDTDSVKLTAKSVDFGDDWWGIGGPLGSGELSFKYSGGKITPHLTGTIHLDGADVATPRSPASRSQSTRRRAPAGSPRTPRPTTPTRSPTT
jgi:hypothetical protein